MDSSNISIIHFSVTSETKFGEKVVISGEGNELANWTPRRGLPLKTDGEKYPVWRSERPLMVKKSRDCVTRCQYCVQDGRVER